MTLAQALYSSAHTLRLNGVDDSQLEARILLQHILNLPQAQVYSECDRLLTNEEVKLLQQLIERRLLGEPSAYIVEHKEFYGNDFCVDPRVLIPRPETELLIEAALEWASDIEHSLPFLERPLRIADIGTGCGAIAITLALKLPQSRVYAIDISPSALQVAQLNCERHEVIRQIVLLQGDLLESLPEPVDLLVANLPYIKNSELANLSPEVALFEPRIAIDGGKDGLDEIGSLLSQLEGKTFPHSCFLLEIGKGQDKKLISLLKRHVPAAKYAFIPDYAGINRVGKITFQRI